MEFHDNNNGNNHNNNNIYMWECQGEEDLYGSRDPADDVLFSFWDGMNQEDDSLLYLLGDQTPIRECRDVSYDISGVESSSRKEVECEKLSLVKRRRVLQFDSDDYEREGNENAQITCINVTSKVTESSVSGYSSEERLQQNTQESSGSREFCDVAPTIKNDVAKQTTNLANLKIFKGKKSFIKTQKKLTTSIVYPFNLIKSCGEQGDLTLKDINHLIHSPPPSKSNSKKDDEPPYLTSAFSGKPVVEKTQIRTEGGKGCITILRTKG
ncbi:protein XRI1-like isoform X2 [Ananas comosus]|uniref:Protein XRI1-like isoform X2 n=1 Tax=Ananas comosus TaxID=4615 RepID=A0A6P5GJX9_ANACO|nr:protein XRI1-like isoform X2 [Ananas comosus]